MPVRLDVVQWRNRCFLPGIAKHLLIGWAHAHKNWTVLQWRKVIWSDKSKFLVFETDGKVCAAFCRYRIPPNYQLPTMKGRGGSVMVYGSSCSKGFRPLDRMEGKMDSKMYVIWPFVRSVDRSGIVFHQDNHPKHKAQFLTKRVRDNNVPWLQRPSQSSDLNAIE
uniref:DDE_3 domain-containing protein n=1 Tax=Haemonchus contortus TaxID=6289 RepID=A0A7I4XY64_HAECO